VRRDEQTVNQEAMLDVTELSIPLDPLYGDAHYLSIDAVVPGGLRPRAWDIHIGQWEPDDPDDDGRSSSTGHPVVECARPAQPGVLDLVQLLDLSAGGQEQLAAWATTLASESLAGTSFVVTDRPNKE
jgi:hypothetical protein